MVQRSVATRLALGLCLSLANPCIVQGTNIQADPSTQTWQVYGGQAAGDHYSSLTQISRGM